MAKQTNKKQLLDDIHTKRNRLEKLLSILGEDEMERPGTTGTWSVKDILAHLAAWEHLLLEWYWSGVQGSSPAFQPVGMGRKKIDSLNHDIYERNKSRSLDEVLSEFHASYKQVLTVMEGMTEEELYSPGRFEWTGGLTLADYVAGNTCNHYTWAKEQIRKRVK